MWEGVVNVFDIDAGSVQPILTSVPRVATFGDKHWFYYCGEDGVGGGYYEEGEMQKAKAAGLKCFLDDTYIQNYFKKIKEMLDEEHNPIKRIVLADLKSISDEALKKLIIEASEYVIESFGYYLACQPQCILGIEEKIQEDLAKIVPGERVLELFTLLSTPTTITTLRKEEIEWMNLLIEAKKKKTGAIDESMKGKLASHHDKYYMLHLGDGAKVLTDEHFFAKFETEIRQPLEALESKLVEIRNSLIRIESQKNEIIKKHNIPKDITDIAHTLAEIGHWRLEMRIRGWMPVQYFNEFLAMEAARRFGVPEEKILYATYKEVLDLFDGIKPDIEMLDNRKKSSLYLIENGQAKLYSGSEAKSRFEQLIEKIDLSKIKEFKGNVAMKGKVTGRAVVFRWGDDMNEKLKLMKEDSILIAGQTRPQLMPLIIKSKGIVTDEGGITSHAAIVSRELRIPCIIGTKIGTLALKDGDMIEVDAEKGIVRKI